MKRILTIVSTILIFSQLLFASGFQINEHGAKAMAMAGAFTGLANDASAVYFNPAALTFMNGTKISVGATYIRPSGSFKGPDGALYTESDLVNQYFTPINFYVAHRLTDKLAIGLGVNNPYGLGTKWEKDWVGRYNAINTEIRVFDFQPVISYKVSDKFSIAVGARIAYADVTIERALPAALTPPVVAQLTRIGDGKLTLEGDDLVVSFSGALFYKANEQWSFGLAYKHELPFEFAGDATVTLPTLPPTIPDAYVPLIIAGLNANYPSGKANAPLNAPTVITAGCAFMTDQKLTLSADFQYTMWSSYDKLEINWEEFTFPDGSTSSVSERDYEDSFIIRIGAEYILSDKFAIRGGFLFDKNPIKDERVDFTLPDNDRYGINIGLGYKLTECMSVDLAYMLLIFPEREITNSKENIADPFIAPTPMNGTYNPSANLIGLNLSYDL